MIHIDTSKAIKEIKSSLGQVTEQQNASAISRALNRGINAGRTVANKEVRTAYNVSAAAFNKAVKIKPASKQNLFATMQISKQPMSVYAFKPKQTDEGVRVSILKKQKKVIKSAFIVAVGSFIGVFARGKYMGDKFEFRKKRIQRKGPDLPIQAIKTVSAGNMVLNSNVFEPVKERAMSVFMHRYSHELKKMLKN
jgi:hypothetical protein